MAALDFWSYTPEPTTVWHDDDEGWIYPPDEEICRPWHPMDGEITTEKIDWFLYSLGLQDNWFGRLSGLPKTISDGDLDRWRDDGGK